MTIISSFLLPLFVTTLLVQLGYWWLIFSTLAKQPPKLNVPNKDPYISIIAVFKNPNSAIYGLLDKLRRQEYSSKEIILMDDYSEPSMKINPNKYPEFKFYKPSENLPGKKKALTEAIDHAQGEYILVTDADCEPASTTWVNRMSSYLNGQTSIVLGYSPYKKAKGFLNAFIRFESWLVGVQYLSYAKKGMPYMGVGRNMLYEKKLFQSVNPFEKHPDLLSGDDDLFINAVATGVNTKICIDHDAFVYSEPKHTWSEYFHQKKRHVSTATTYKRKHIFLLGLFSASQILAFVIGCILILTHYWLFVLSIFSIYMMLKWFVARQLLLTLKEEDLIPLFPILDVIYTLFIVVLSPFLFFTSKKW